MTNHNASKAKTVLNRLWIYGMMGASGVLVACAAPPNPAPNATIRSDLLNLETRIQNLENQSNVQNQMQMEWSSVQDRIEKLEKLQENIQEIKRLERNQNQLLLEYQQEFEDRMARLEADLERNSQRIRKITANEELQNGTGISSEQASSQTGSAQDLETFGSILQIPKYLSPDLPALNSNLKLHGNCITPNSFLKPLNYCGNSE